jgi:hypothetical protein
MPPEQPIERLPEQQVGAAKREQQFSKLRELTLVLAADVVDHQLVHEHTPAYTQNQSPAIVRPQQTL